MISGSGMRLGDIFITSNGKQLRFVLRAIYFHVKMPFLFSALEIFPSHFCVMLIRFWVIQFFQRLIILMLRVDLHLELMFMLVSSKLTWFVLMVFHPSMNPPSPFA
jgi:hypothetical protein